MAVVAFPHDRPERHAVTGAELLRAPFFHTPANAFHAGGALVCHEDGGLLIRDGRIVDSGDFTAVRKACPDVPVTDWRGGFVLPGFVDTHVHFPQLHILGGLGRTLLDWLEHVALPEEARMADVAYATDTADQFVRALAAHGTTTALVPSCTRHPATPTVTSASEGMLEMCGTLLAEHAGVRVQTHINESVIEIAEVSRLFPWAADYLAVYERFGLTGSRTVLAHDVHPTDSELQRLAAGRTSIAHCPSSNAALGNGIFPLHRHVQAGVTCAVGTDVGGGTGFGMLKEGLQAHLMQRVAGDEMTLDPARLCYLVTKAGAEAVGLGDTIGDLLPGKMADLVFVQPPDGTPLAAVLSRVQSPEEALAAIFTLAGPESICEVRVAGQPVHRAS